MELLETLLEGPGLPAWQVPDEVRRLYDGPIGFDGPRTVANLVQTIDGVVAIPELARSNALVAAGSAADGFVLALLRACADVVLIGARTLAASPAGTWRADRPFPAAAAALQELRASRGLAEHPAVAIVTSGRSFDASHPVLERGAIVLTTAGEARRLRAAVPAAATVVAAGDGNAVDLRAALALLRREGHGLVLTEGGPTLLASLLRPLLVDELFLTVSPLLAGRDVAPRPALVEGAELLPGHRVEGSLRSLRRGGSHLFLRYALSGAPAADGGESRAGAGRRSPRTLLL